MPIIGVILTTVVIWTLYWFFRMGGLEQMQAKRAQRKDTERLGRARESQRKAPLHAVDDPRDAAMVLMMLMAREGGDPTREHIAAIEKISHSTFGFGHDLGARMTQARFIASRADSFAQAAALFSDLFNKKLMHDEKRQLVDMIEEVANFEGGSDAHAQAIDGLSRRLGLLPAS
ncbi:MAG TPA: hypothetical protein VIY51_02420 [Xanthobacteraceae bacterium]